MSENGSSANGNGNGEVEFRTEDEALQVLLDGDIDKVMSGLDRIIEATGVEQLSLMFADLRAHASVKLVL